MSALGLVLARCTTPGSATTACSSAQASQHSLDGWNIGPAPYGYLADRIPHPVKAKAAPGRTKSRLISDPQRGAPGAALGPGIPETAVVAGVAPQALQTR